MIDLALPTPETSVFSAVPLDAVLVQNIFRGLRVCERIRGWHKAPPAALQVLLRSLLSATRLVISETWTTQAVRHAPRLVASE